MRRLHHKALSRRRPRDQVRYGFVFKHTVYSTDQNHMRGQRSLRGGDTNL